MGKMSAEEIINFIGNSKKTTPVKVYLKGKLRSLKVNGNVKSFSNEKMGIFFGESEEIDEILELNKDIIEDYVIENNARNSAVPMLDKRYINARIEPGAIIRDFVEIGDNVVIMMGSIINIGSSIGSKTMIDMGAVLGGRAEVGENCHIGAGAVLAGVIEPSSAIPVRICDNVLIGANAVILEGVRVGSNSVVAAGAVVVEDVPEGVVVAGVPAKVIKDISQVDVSKVEIKAELRKL